MNSTRKKRIYKRLLMAGLVWASLFAVSFTTESTSAAAASVKTCAEADNGFYNSLANFDIAFNSLFFNSPTSCATDCVDSPNPQQCEILCTQTRQTNLANAQLGILQAGGEIEGCTDPGPSFCDIAQIRDQTCVAAYDPMAYSDLEQRLEIGTALWACRSASGVSMCQ